MEFNFDKWLQLHNEDPEEFERRRKEVLTNVLATIPEEAQAKFRRLQWRIDAERKRHRSPMGSLVALQNMMYDVLYREGGFVDAVNVLSGQKEAACLSLPPKKGSALIFFRKKE